MSSEDMDSHSTVYEHLSSIGCCRTCCLRFLGIIAKSSYKFVETTLTELGIPIVDLNDDVSPIKQAKPNPCVGCLGLLQKPYCHDILDTIVKSVDLSEYDTKTFNVSMNLPSCHLLRSKAVLADLRQRFPGFYEKNFKILTSLGLKDSFKAAFGHHLEKRFNLVLDLSSGFVIDVEFRYDDDLKECKPLSVLQPTVFTGNYVRKSGYTKNRIEAFLDKVKDEEFSTAFQVPPPVPSSTIKVVNASIIRESANVAGRYNKYSRTLPQTPWLLNGERKMESSVEELISGPLVAALRGTSSKFASSGREDVDVRSLGFGRPFNVEVLTPKSAFISCQQLRQLEAEIFEKSEGKVRVRDLQIVPRESLTALKQGEEEKTKDYRALCICPDGIPPSLEEAAKKTQLILNQSTPIRVLHRRPVAVRQREIVEMSVERLEGDSQKFVLNVKTQAGTYVKEFIHGDLGRTKPSLGDLLGGVRVDILALDVTNVSLDWPPKVDYDALQTNEIS